MARLFDDIIESKQYLETDVAMNVAAYPFTFAAWFNTDDDTIYQCLLSLSDKSESNVNYRLYAAGVEAGDPVQCIAQNTTSRSAESTSGFTANTWHHACGLFIGDESRSALIDGGSSGNQGQAATFTTNVDRTSIGRLGDSTPGKEMSGAIAEVAVWDVELSTVEVLELATGFSPMFIRRGNLVHYWRLLNNDKDCIGGLDLTPVNSPTWTDHPKIIYPCGPI